LSKWEITVSMKKAPVNQEIDFLSTWSVWQIVWYHWDFGDWNTSNEANPSHAYSKPWQYKVVLTLEYANNNIITLDTVVEITE
jgi:microbial collagenase